jgi:hypothetical protein
MQAILVVQMDKITVPCTREWLALLSFLQLIRNHSTCLFAHLGRCGGR